MAAVFTDTSRLSLQLSSQFLASKTAEYKAYTAAQLAWMKQERSQVDISAMCVAPCILVPSSAISIPEEAAPILMLDVGKLELSTSQFDENDADEAAYEANLLQVRLHYCCNLNASTGCKNSITSIPINP